MQFIDPFINLEYVRNKNCLGKFLILFLLLIVSPINSFGFTQSARNTISVDELGRAQSSTKEGSGYLPMSDCKMEESELLDSSSNIFRTGITNLQPKKIIKAMIFNVDFDDLKSPHLYAPSMSTVTKQISSYFASVSNGHINFRWVEEKLIHRMPLSLVNYGTGSRQHSNESVQIIRDAQKVAFKENSLGGFNYFIVVTPPAISRSQLSTSLSLLQSESELINSTILASDFWRSGKSWTILAHEIGHALGLLDLYSYQSAEQVNMHPSYYLRQFQYMKYYDLMNWPTGPAPEMSAWSRWELGVLNFEQVRCLPNFVTETNLEAIESQNGGIKALFLKMNEFQMLVMENRQAIGFDRTLPESARGVIVYLVNLREKSGLGPQRLMYPIQSKENSNSTTLHVDGVQNIGDYKIECLRYSKFQARIRVSKALRAE